METNTILVLSLVALGVVFLIRRIFMASTMISVEDASKLVSENKAVLLDIREMDEVRQGMAEPAQWLPLSKITSQSNDWKKFIESTPKNLEVILYCASGGRASMAKMLFEQAGFKTHNMGGMSKWAFAGLPVRQGP